MKGFAMFLLVMISAMLSSCGAIETIFKAGMYWAFFLIAIVVIIILWVVFKARKK